MSQPLLDGGGMVVIALSPAESEAFLREWRFRLLRSMAASSQRVAAMAKARHDSKGRT